MLRAYKILWVWLLWLPLSLSASSLFLLLMESPGQVLDEGGRKEAGKERERAIGREMEEKGEQRDDEREDNIHCTHIHNIMLQFLLY